MLSGIFLYGENMKRLLIAGVVLLVSASALAEDCDNATSQTEMNMCSAGQYQAADKKLNQTWQTALKRAAPQQRELLKKAQKNWIACAMPTARLSAPAPKKAAHSPWSSTSA
jgi:uncharacterized protein YecT (DUF1311 family)